MVGNYCEESSAERKREREKEREYICGTRYRRLYAVRVYKRDESSRFVIENFRVSVLYVYIDESISKREGERWRKRKCIYK